MSKYLDNMKLYFSKWIIPFCLFLAFLLFYSYTMFDGIGGRINYGDSAKWQYLHYVNGLPHGPGYPQFLVLTELFSRVIFFLPEPERITFISVFFGALAVTFFYILLNLLTGNRLGSMVVSLFFGVTYAFWTQATEAEVYTLNIAYLLAVFYLFIKYHQTERPVFFIVGCIVYAISFGNHLSMVTILPAIIFITFTSNYRKVITLRNIVIIALAIIGGALQYGFVFYRAYQVQDPLFAELPLKPEFSSFLSYVTGPKNIMFHFSLGDVLFERMKVFFSLLIDELSVFGIILSFGGLFYWVYEARSWRVIVFLVLAMLGQFVFHIGYDVNDIIVFFIPVYMILALFAGLVFYGKRRRVLVGVFLLNICLLVGYNVKKRKILSQNIYDAEHFALLRTMYTGGGLPLYFPVFDNYYYWAYINYLNVSGELDEGQKILLKPEQLENVDSFYVALGHLGFVDPNFFDAEPAEVQDVLSFVKNNAGGDNAIFISACDEAAGNLDESFKEYIGSKGGKIAQLNYRGAYCAVLANGMLLDRVNNNEMFTEINSDGIKELEPLVGRYAYKIESKGLEAGNLSSFRINDFEYMTTRRGLNIIVWNMSKGRVSTIASFDTHSGNMPALYKAKRKIL